MSDQTEIPSDLAEGIRNYILNYFGTNSGMPLTFVCAIDWIDGTDGASTLTIATFDEQPTHRSLGLVRYMDSWFDDDARNEMTQSVYAAMDTDDEDED